MRTAVVFTAFATLTVLLSGSAVSTEAFVQAEGTQLHLGGKPYRAIGVNIPHLSQAYLGTWHHWKGLYGTREAMRQTIVDAVIDAERHDVAFVRFFASPGYPKGTAELYLNDKEFRRQLSL